MRTKEDAHDYRYFPEPDLPPLAVSPEWKAAVAASLPELPSKKKGRFIHCGGLSPYDAGVLTSSLELALYFEDASLSCGANKKLLVNWITTDLLGRLNAEKKEIAQSPIKPRALGELIQLIEAGKISGKMAKDVFEKMWTSGKSAAEIVADEGLSQVSDTAQLEAWARQALEEQPKAAADVKAGNFKAIGALVGAVMKKSKGKANPAALNEIFKKILA